MEKKFYYDVLINGELYAFCSKYETALNMAGNYVKRYPGMLIEVKNENSETVWSSTDLWQDMPQDRS